MRRHTLRALVGDLADQAKPDASWCAIKALGVVEGVDTARIDIYQPIGYWDYSAAEFVQAVARLSVGAIEVHLNSPGGDCFDGIAIKNVLSQHPARVTVVVDALAASIATVIAMGADEIVMAPGAMMMIHDAWTYDAGNAADLRKAADLLDQVSDNIADIYAARTGMSKDEARALMLIETWFNAEEAVAAGLADRVGEGVVATPGAADDEDPLLAHHDLGIFAYAGRDAAPAPKLPKADAEVDETEAESAVETSDDPVIETPDDAPPAPPKTEVIDFAALLRLAREAVS